MSSATAPRASTPVAVSSPFASRSRRLFGIKDLFTSINALGGAVAICLCIDGRPFAAGVAVMLGYLLGDTLDGWVARRLGTQNQFGAEYDTIADHLAHCIAPGAIVYTVYRHAELGIPDLWTQVLAGVLGSAIMLAASIRHARNIVRPVKYKGVWAGLPRSILGFVAISYANSALAPYAVGGRWLGVPLIFLLCVATLTYLPFPNHHLPRKHHWVVRLGVFSFLTVPVVVLLLRREFFFDVLFGFTSGYSLLSWTSLTPSELRDYRSAVARARAEGS